jgi:hypothetical protein
MCKGGGQEMKKLLMLLLCLPGLALGTVFGVGQTGSFMGLLSTGAGIEHGAMQYSLSAGYTPEALAGETLLGITPRTDIGTELTAEDFKARLFVGTGILFSLDKSTFVVLPKKYPRGYYPSTGMLFGPYWGMEIKKKQHGFFIEGTTTDFYIELYLHNRSMLSITDVCTWGVGYKYYFSHTGE